MKFFLSILLLISQIACAQTIAEKKQSLLHGGGSGDLSAEMQQRLEETNGELLVNYHALDKLNSQALEYYHDGASEDQWRFLVEKRLVVIQKIDAINEEWRLLAKESPSNTESYALWSQPETTIGQLVADYGAQDFVYVIPNEIAALKLTIDSSLPIPKKAWGEMLELLLRENGIEIKQINPYLRQLYFVSQDKSSIVLITNKRSELALLPPQARIAFVLTPQPAEVRRIWLFLDKFINPNKTSLQQVGRDIIIIGQRAEIEELLKLYDFAISNRGDKEFKIVPLGRIDAEEIAKILAAIFDQAESKSKNNIYTPDKPMMMVTPQTAAGKGGARPGLGALNRPPVRPNNTSPEQQGSAEENGLKVIVLNKVVQALFLVGTKEEIDKAEQIIVEVERRLGEAREKVLWWYTVKYSQAEELADILSRIYMLMVTTGTGAQAKANGKEGEINASATANVMAPPPRDDFGELYAARVLEQNQFYAPGGNVIARRPLGNRDDSPQIINDRDNFIVDLKTGTIIMVVEADLIPKIKELLRKIDVPKKMVQIEVLLFEKNLDRGTDFGLNFLRAGECASQKNKGCFDFNGDYKFALPDLFPDMAGITQFFLSRKKGSGIPAFDLIYRFLINQHSIQINASPSIVTVNQTAAKIDIVEEISVDVGTVISATAPSTTQSKFERQQYGTIIEVKPTIHSPQERESYEDRTDYITLETDITFQTFPPGSSRPDVTTRHLTNEVRVADGQTVIIGGLRRKVNDDHKFSIPYIGEIPGLGKLFSYTELRERNAEMFLFITPKIISDPLEDFERLKYEEMCRRPGDIPSFLCHLVAARNWERDRALQGTMRMLFGPESDRCVEPFICEYDGR